MGKWEFLAMEQNGRGGVCGWKITKAEHQRDSGQTNLARFLMKAGQGDWISLVGWWRMTTSFQDNKYIHHPKHIRVPL